MTDFVSALRTGINSAINREENFIEIHSIFSAVKEQIAIFSEGKLETQLDSNTKDHPYLRTINYFEDTSQLYLDKILKISSIIRTLKLTEIYFDRDNGYPCTILIDGDEFTSTNKESLEDNIRKLLSSPSTGIILYSLIKDAP